MVGSKIGVRFRVCQEMRNKVQQLQLFLAAIFFVLESAGGVNMCFPHKVCAERIKWFSNMLFTHRVCEIDITQGTFCMVLANTHRSC